MGPCIQAWGPQLGPLKVPTHHTKGQGPGQAQHSRAAVGGLHGSMLDAVLWATSAATSLGMTAWPSVMAHHTSLGLSQAAPCPAEVRMAVACTWL
jgi:hypothetical protein